ncbi:MAG: hypothetical protein N3G77_07485 [Nitrososphaeria archaeon]|nr:hypothetical protein [Nitrososphaeria archaeon]MDW7987032.1 hypothetical protein [Nitrososphaerota archaeon]
MISILLISQILIMSGSFWNNVEQDSWIYTRPWGLGLTIPNGSPLEGGDTVKWSKHRNITAIFSLPNINYTDNTIYLIVSIMTKSGTIIQAAAGLYQNSTYWSSYIMYVTEISYKGKTYVPVRLNSTPYFFPNDKVAISIYYRNCEDCPEGCWASSIVNLSTSEKIDVKIVVDNSSTFMDGEQEVIALESYTYNEEVFKNMGEVILYSILVDGKKVLGGWYVDDGQVFNRRPLFEVGGGQVPPFISIILKENNTIAWTYSKLEWNNSSHSILSMSFILTVIISAIVVFYIGYRIDYKARPRKSILRNGAKQSKAPTTVTRESILKGFTKDSRVSRISSIGTCTMFK